MDNQPKPQPQSVQSSDGYNLDCRVWLPTSDTPTVAACLFVHGGAFTHGDCDSHQAVSQALVSDCSMAVVTCSFRNGGVAPHATGKTMDDLSAVIRFVREKWSNVPVGVVGSSSGGYFALALTRHIGAELSTQHHANDAQSLDFCIPICPVANPGKRARYLSSCINGTAEEDGYAFYQTNKDVATSIQSAQLSFWEKLENAHEAGDALDIPSSVPTLMIIGACDTNVPPQVTSGVQSWATRTISIGGRGHEICNAPPIPESWIPDVKRFVHGIAEERRESSRM